MRPLLWGRHSPLRIFTERLFQPVWFLKERDARIIKPPVINVPGFRLAHHFGAHHGFGREQSQKTDLSDPAETETCVFIQARKPARRDGMVDVPFRRQRNPDIHIREKG